MKIEATLTDKGLAIAGGLFGPRSPVSYNALPDQPFAGFWRRPGFLCFGIDPKDPSEPFMRRPWPRETDPAQ